MTSGQGMNVGMAMRGLNAAFAFLIGIRTYTSHAPSRAGSFRRMRSTTSCRKQRVVPTLQKNCKAFAMIATRLIRQPRAAVAQGHKPGKRKRRRQTFGADGWPVSDYVSLTRFGSNLLPLGGGGENPYRYRSGNDRRGVFILFCHKSGGGSKLTAAFKNIENIVFVYAL